MDFYGQWELELTWIVLKQLDQAWSQQCSVQQNNISVAETWIYFPLYFHTLSLSTLSFWLKSVTGEKSSTYYREEVKVESKGKIIEKNVGWLNSDNNDVPLYFEINLNTLLIFGSSLLEIRLCSALWWQDQCCSEDWGCQLLVISLITLPNCWLGIILNGKMIKEI